MTGTLQRRLLVLIAAATTAIVCWKSIPGTTIDRAAFSAVVRGSANPPFFISGNDSQSAPWQLRTVTPADSQNSDDAPAVIALGDDLEGYFQSSPPSPIDLAVIFSNMRRLGGKSAASAAVLAWDAPDPIGLMALDKAIESFDTLVMAAPLSRGAVPEQMPASFRKASIPLDRIQGNLSSIPVVNRIPLSGIILGRKNTLAGFQTLESEPDTGFIPLIARWDDRVVFAFPLLAAIQRLEIRLDAVEIRPGQYIKLGTSGPIVPIDKFGRMSVRLKPTPAPLEIPAEALIDGDKDLIPTQAKGPMILLDDRSNAAPATLTFTKFLPATVSTIASDTVLAPAHAYPRVSTNRELKLLSVLVLLLAAICRLPTTFTRNIGFLFIAAVCIVTQCIAAGTTGLWLPGLPGLAAVVAAFLTSRALVKLPPPGSPLPVVPRATNTSPPAEPLPPKKPSPNSPGAAKPRARGKKRRR